MPFLEDNMAQSLDDLEYDSDFLDKTPKVGSIKEIIDMRGPNAGCRLWKGKDVDA